MMPDLGKYATEVGLAYGISILLIVLLVAQSLWQSRKVKARLKREESAAKRDV